MTQSALDATKEETKSESKSPETIHGGTSYTPRVDILETDSELLIYADLPGCKPEDVDVRCENGQLEIYGKCAARQENVAYLLNEYGVGDFYRSFTINETIDTEKITAKSKQGVLAVHLPKLASATPKRIPIVAE
jgi:HSP20 family protein